MRKYIKMVKKTPKKEQQYNNLIIYHSNRKILMKKANSLINKIVKLVLLLIKRVNHKQKGL